MTDSPPDEAKAVAGDAALEAGGEQRDSHCFYAHATTCRVLRRHQPLRLGREPSIRVLVVVML